MTALTNNNVFGGASATAGGSIGLVPAPLAGYQSRFLRGDAMWARIPEESINLIVSSGASSDVIIDAFSYPPNRQGVLWMDYVDDEYVLKLHVGEYDYIFKPDKYTPADIAPPPATEDILGEIYYLETVPSTVTGGMWYTVDSAGHPTLWVHRAGTQYSFDFGYSYDTIAFKGSQANLYSYWLWRPNVSRDLLENTWTTSIKTPVVEKTDHGVYALRNMNTALTTTYATSAGWTHTFKGTYKTSASSATTYTGLVAFTIDFWLSWNADTSDDTTAVTAVGDTELYILKLTGGTHNCNNTGLVIASYTITTGLILKNTGLHVKHVGTLYPLNNEYSSVFENNGARRIHIAITHSGQNSAMKLYINGIWVRNFGANNLTSGSTTKTLYLYGLKSVQIFPYMVGEEVGARGLYIDHFRIWDKVIWGEDFEVPKESDYIIW